MAALHHLAVTWFLGSQVTGRVLRSRSLDVGFSSCTAPTSIMVQGFHTYPGISDPWVLGLGSAGVGCEDVSRQWQS